MPLVDFHFFSYPHLCEWNEDMNISNCIMPTSCGSDYDGYGCALLNHRNNLLNNYYQETCITPLTDESALRDNTDSWKDKPVKTWTGLDIIDWINFESRSLGIYCTDFAGEKFFKMDGVKLLEMSAADFSNIDSKYGDVLYERFRLIVSNKQKNHSSHGMPSPGATYTILGQRENTSNMKNETSDYSREDYNSTFDEISQLQKIVPAESHENMTSYSPLKKKDMEPKIKIMKKKPGRPRGTRKKKKPEKKLGRLWEFIRDLLKDRKYCPNIISWENHDEGTFRFVHSDEVAKLWGKKKENPQMNYEKMSRAMRYYYKSEVFLPVTNRRLVYKFGPNAVGWRVENPNFKN